MKTKILVFITLLIILLSGCTTHAIKEDDINKTVNTFLNFTCIKPILEFAYPTPELTLKNGNNLIQYSSKGNLTYKSLAKSTLIYKINNTPSEEYIEINSESDSTTIEFDNVPDKITERIYKDNKLIKVSDVKNDALRMPSHEGLYRIELECFWEKEDSESLEGELIYSFDFYYNMPSKFKISSDSLQPGGNIIIHAENIKDSDTINVNTTLFNNTIEFYPEPYGYFAIIPIDGALTPMDYSITIESSEDNVKFEDTVTVLEREYETQHLYVSPSTLSLRSQENIEKNIETLTNSRDINNSSKTILWFEPFIVPSEGIITTEYYQIRYTNGNPTPRFHTGIDIAAPYNTPILATNSGKVVVAEEMTLTGNTLVIDHGCGFFSTYCHLNTMYFEPGENINRGNILGLMGSTGFSTGPHLHFEIFYNGVYLDPEFFYDKDPYRDSLIIK